ncbi:hypothetical protein ANN_13332 [Periplaneta americana]|uniref:Uncharacterized protein n=1 Tax=Periplaneta americana TaxID=6978 RepID=A0ABQ8TJA4_PERAM|nr:hypothetical protein ANN_13332 [Periplaneta americana]
MCEKMPGAEATGNESAGGAATQIKVNEGPGKDNLLTLVVRQQTDLNRINDWAIANKMKINSLKSKAVSFTKKGNKIVASYTLGGETIPEVNKCKYLGITFSSDLGWGEHVTDTAGKAWRALHIVMRVLRKGSDKAKEIAYESLVRPVMEYGAACWDPYRLEHIKTLEKIQKRALKCCRKNSPLKWDTLKDRRTRIRLCALFKTYRDDSRALKHVPEADEKLKQLEHLEQLALML